MIRGANSAGIGLILLISKTRLRQTREFYRHLRKDTIEVRFQKILLKVVDVGYLRPLALWITVRTGSDSDWVPLSVHRGSLIAGGTRLQLLREYQNGTLSKTIS